MVKNKSLNFIVVWYLPVSVYFPEDLLLCVC